MITAPNKPNLFRLDNFCDCLLNIYKNELNYQIKKHHPDYHLQKQLQWFPLKKS